MKLAQRYNRINIFISIIILILSGGIYYTVIHFILTEKLDKDLMIEEKEILAYVQKYNQLPAPGDFLHQRVAYRKLGSHQAVKRSFFYQDYYDGAQRKSEPGRTLKVGVPVGSNVYEVTITKSRVESEGLITIIFFITLGITLFLLLTLILVNRFILKSLWKPFYETLHALQSFSISGSGDLSLKKTNTDEFNSLNVVVNSMSVRVREDYKKLKTFTDNASHEMMTPLAVINAKLDGLVQNEALTEVQSIAIEDIYLSVGKLNRLNQALLLLAKIENKLVGDKESFDLKTLVEEKIRQFHELFLGKEIQVTHTLEVTAISINKHLADVLLNNLISNAIRHNFVRGVVDITLQNGVLAVKNTSDEPKLNALHTFERFYKNPTSEGLGLGLAIVKQISELYNFRMEYEHDENGHIFKIIFEHP